MSKKSEDFAPQPTYSQSKNSNDSWVAVTTIRTDSDGSKTQTIAIEPKPR